MMMKCARAARTRTIQSIKRKSYRTRTSSRARAVHNLWLNNVTLFFVRSVDRFVVIRVVWFTRTRWPHERERDSSGRLYSCRVISIDQFMSAFMYCAMMWCCLRGVGCVHTRAHTYSASTRRQAHIQLTFPAVAMLSLSHRVCVCGFPVSASGWFSEGRVAFCVAVAACLKNRKPRR